MRVKDFLQHDGSVNTAPVAQQAEMTGSSRVPTVLKAEMTESSRVPRVLTAE